MTNKEKKGKGKEKKKVQKTTNVFFFIFIRSTLYSSMLLNSYTLSIMARSVWPNAHETAGTTISREQNLDRRMAQFDKVACRLFALGSELNSSDA